MNHLPQRVQDDLKHAEALEAAEAAARAQARPPVLSLADLTAPPAPVEPSPPATPAVAPAAPVQDDAKIEHKYRVLQGMYEADVRRMRETVEALRGEIKALREAPAAAPAPAAQLDPKDVEAFGEDMMDMVRRYITAAVAAVEQRLLALESSVGDVTKDTAQTKEAQFYALLTQLVPDWRAVNASEGWLQWLGVEDSVYGVARQAALDAAFKRLDAPQVAKIFKAYVASIPPKPETPTTDDQITPSTAGNAAPTPQAPKPILSERAITAFYNDKARGVYAGREAEAQALEAQIDAAVAEGRVSR